MTNYTVKDGKWEDFFSFELPDLIYSRTKSHTFSPSKEYPPDSKYDIPKSILEVSVYNPTAYKNHKVLKAKFWLDKDGKTDQINRLEFYKFSEYLFELDNLLHEIGEEIKLTVFIDRSLKIQFKEPSDFSSDLLFKIFKKRIKEFIPIIENWLIELLKEDHVKINDYITLELKESSRQVNCNGKSFWTLIQDDIRRSELTEPEEFYEDWFKNEYLPRADDKFQPKDLSFSDVCKIFQRWNDNSLKNLDFTWHFYGRLMEKLRDAGHLEAAKIFNSEIFKRNIDDRGKIRKKNSKRRIQVGAWNEFFDCEIPKKKLKNIDFWNKYEYDAEKMIPRSILDVEIHDVQQPSDRWIEAKFYLERNDEMREVEYENDTYFKYIEFLTKKNEILGNLGEEIKMISHLDGSTSISFMNPKFTPKEIIFPDFKKKVNQIFIEEIDNKF